MKKAFCVVILVVLIIAVTSYRVHRRRDEEGTSCSGILGHCKICSVPVRFIAREALRRIYFPPHVFKNRQLTQASFVPC